MIQLPTTYSSDSKKKDLQSRYTIPNRKNRQKEDSDQSNYQTNKKKKKYIKIKQNRSDPKRAT